MTESAWSLHRPSAAYAPADGTYRAVTAPLWRRICAAALDWTSVFVVFLIASYPIGMLQTLASAVGGNVEVAIVDLTQALGLGIVLAYFGWFVSTGHTLGMRAFDIHVFAHGTGRDPHPLRAIARSLLSVGFFLATIDAYGLSTGAYKEGLTDAQATWRTAALTGVGLALAGGLWCLVDPRGRTVWDRLFGLVVVEDVVPASMPDRLWSPWGT
jgi:uncharacterized RDD family membrane protein YckC